MEVSNGKYVKHLEIREELYDVVDASTIGGPRPHNDVIWIRITDGGCWFAPDEAEAFARTIIDVAASHRERVAREVARATFDHVNGSLLTMLDSSGRALRYEATDGERLAFLEQVEMLNAFAGAACRACCDYGKG